MEPIPIAAYRRPQKSLAVRERPVRPRLRSESVPGERILADLATSHDDPHGAGRILARYAAARMLAGQADRAEAKLAFAAWRGFIAGTAECRHLEDALRTSGRARYGALLRAATAAALVGHTAGAFALSCMAWKIAADARMRRPARRAARHAARWARRSGSPGTARLWRTRARRLR